MIHATAYRRAHLLLRLGLRLTPALLLLFLAGTCAPPPERTNYAGLHVAESLGRLDLNNGDDPILTYWTEPQLPAGLPEHYTRSGFIHPLRSPAGLVLTDDFPAGYAHQHGLFTAWANTTFRDTFVDFWNTHKDLATVSHAHTAQVYAKDDYAGFRAVVEHRSHVHQGMTVLREELYVRANPYRGVNVVDLRSWQTNVTTDTLHLNKHLYGGLGLRGSKHWNPADSLHFTGPARFLTDEGKDLATANHTRPRWTAIYGELPGGSGGIAIIPHPDNPRFPQSVRVHPELPYFSVSPVVIGPAAIAPGEVMANRYRIVLFDGEPPVALLDELAGKAASE